jgi:serine O-acetyltransferase
MELSQITTAILADYNLGRTIDTTISAGRPTMLASEELLEKLRILLFPGFYRGSNYGSLEAYVSLLVAEIHFRLEAILLPMLSGNQEKCHHICMGLLEDIPRIRALLQQDLQAFFTGDPAASSESEIIAAYPGYYALMVHRLANSLHHLGTPVLPRLLAEIAHSHTGIDIHPGASIGPACFIDHGTGVVIGETTVIGKHVKIYQGVTLGALSTRGGQGLKGKKRHPTIEDGVTIYASASILGGGTVIGAGATIGGNAFVTRSVPPGATVIGSQPDL